MGCRVSWHMNTHEMLLAQISDMSSEGLSSTSLFMDEAPEKSISFEKFLLKLNLRQDAHVIAASATISGDLVSFFLKAIVVDAVLPKEIYLLSFLKRSTHQDPLMKQLHSLRSRTPTGCRTCIVHPCIPFLKGLGTRSWRLILIQKKRLLSRGFTFFVNSYPYWKKGHDPIWRTYFLKWVETTN